MLVEGTLLFIVSWMASVSLLHVVFNSPGVWIREGGGCPSKLPESVTVLTE
jgi:hypothetical protein